MRVVVLVVAIPAIRANAKFPIGTITITSMLFVIDAVFHCLDGKHNSSVTTCAAATLAKLPKPGVRSINKGPTKPYSTAKFFSGFRNMHSPLQDLGIWGLGLLFAAA